MNKSILEKTINKTKDKIGELKDIYDLIVLKGIPLEPFELDRPSVEKIIENKPKYFISLIQNKRIINYEEFLSLGESLLPLYEKILVINNNLYINWYPLTSIIDKDISVRLLKHFDEDIVIEDCYIGKLNEYLNIFGNYKQLNGNEYVAFNEIDSNEKIDIIDLFSIGQSVEEQFIFNEMEEVIEIIDEDDYLNLIDKLNNEIRSINIKKISFDMDEYKRKIDIIRYYFGDIINIRIGIQEKVKEIQKDYSEYINILQRYWGKDEFLNIKNYDTNKLEEGIKEVYNVSQGEIIDSIVNQSVKALEGRDYRDIFVTAPTGSGKSAIFQIPAIYLAEKYGLFTIVISPLIGLMNDQVKNLEMKNYDFSRTINSDMSPIKRQEILEDINENRCHILYISPETLLSRSDISQLIGNRKIGLFVIDEAHIVTTWGKQFRPDYWFLGEHIRKVRKKQQKDIEGHSFPIATFTATAIYNGIEDMYKETKNSLYLPNPITYLGYIKRDNININIDNSVPIKNKDEYELDKFETLIKQIHKANILNKKMLIYFPTVALINRFYDYCKIKNLDKSVTIYHGQLDKNQKTENYEMFYNKQKNIMLATKAFGMGIDIDDIEIIVHFAPTGNVCDYVQEIGRAARRRDLVGEAYYNYMSNDFKHINRLHGISIVKEYQLVQVIKKINELFKQKIKSPNNDILTKKGRSMLIDADSFSHIFENPFFDQEDAINKVKTAMLIIQKDFEQTRGFAPFHMRAIPLFSQGFFYITKEDGTKMEVDYPNTIKEINEERNIVSINLEKIWDKKYSSAMSFPKFKYLLYTKSKELEFKYKEMLKPALMIDISYQDNYLSIFNKYKRAFEDIIYTAVREEKFYSTDDIGRTLTDKLKISIYNAKTVTEVFIGAMQFYARDYNTMMFGRMFTPRTNADGITKFKFNNPVSEYFKWMHRTFKNIEQKLVDGKLFLVNDDNTNFREYLLFLGLVEVFGVLSFKSLGGESSQIYIYVNETKTMDSIVSKPYNYKNRLLEMVNQRHKISVATLSYLFEEKLSSDERWDYIENYFLGIVPDEILKQYESKYGEVLDLSNY